MTWIYKRTWNPQSIPNNLISKSQILISMFGCPNGHSLAFWRKRMSWLLCRATCCMRCGNPSPRMQGMGISLGSSGEVQLDLPVMLIGWLYWNVAWNLWHFFYDIYIKTFFFDHQEISANPWCEPVSEWNPPWLIISPRKSPTILQRRSAAMPRAHFASEIHPKKSKLCYLQILQNTVYISL